MSCAMGYKKLIFSGPQCISCRLTMCSKKSFFQLDRIYRTVLFRSLTAAGIFACLGIYYL